MGVIEFEKARFLSITLIIEEIIELLIKSVTELRFFALRWIKAESGLTGVVKLGDLLAVHLIFSGDLTKLGY